MNPSQDPFSFHCDAILSMEGQEKRCSSLLRSSLHWTTALSFERVIRNRDFWRKKKRIGKVWVVSIESGMKENIIDDRHCVWLLRRVHGQTIIVFGVSNRGWRSNGVPHNMIIPCLFICVTMVSVSEPSFLPMRYRSVDERARWCIFLIAVSLRRSD